LVGSHGGLPGHDITVRTIRETPQDAQVAPAVDGVPRVGLAPELARDRRDVFAGPTGGIHTGIMAYTSVWVR